MYRLDSLADRASDQAVLPHVAALVALRNAQSETHALLVMDVSWPNGDTAEIDIFGYMGTQVVSGEVKTSSDAFSRRQLTRDVGVSSRVGATAHVLAAADLIPAKVIADCRALCHQRGLHLIAVGIGDDGVMQVL